MVLIVPVSERCLKLSPSLRLRHLFISNKIDLVGFL